MPASAQVRLERRFQAIYLKLDITSGLIVCLSHLLCLNSANFALKAHCHSTGWINKTMKKKRIRQGSIILLYSEIHELIYSRNKV